MSAVFSGRNVVGMLVILSVLFVGGCNKFSGKYSATIMGSTMTIDFKSGGKAASLITTEGKDTETVEATYEKDGNKITVHSPKKGEADAVFTLDNDGNLVGPMGMKLTKQ